MSRNELRSKALRSKRKIPGWVFLVLTVFAVVLIVWADHTSWKSYKQAGEELQRGKDLDKQRLAR